jgi:hypothetical protein
MPCIACCHTLLPTHPHSHVMPGRPSIQVIPNEGVNVQHQPGYKHQQGGPLPRFQQGMLTSFELWGIAEGAHYAHLQQVGDGANRQARQWCPAHTVHSCQLYYTCYQTMLIQRGHLMDHLDCSEQINLLFCTFYQQSQFQYISWCIETVCTLLHNKCALDLWYNDDGAAADSTAGTQSCMIRL